MRRFASQRLGAGFVVAGALAAACSTTPLSVPLVEAERLERAHQYDAALAAFKRAETECPGQPRDCVRAALGRAQLLESRGQVEGALLAYEAIERNAAAHSAMRARALASAGELTLERLSGDGERGKAAGEMLLWATIDRYPGEVGADRALAALVRNAKRNKRLPQLVASLDQAFLRHRQHFIGEHLAYAAAEAVALTDESDALRRFSELAKSYPKGVRVDDALWRSGEILRRKGQIDAALEAFARLVRRFERSYITGSYNSIYMDDAQLAIAEIYLRDKHDPARAIDAARTLMKLFPDSRLKANARWLAAEALRAQNNSAGACDELSRIVSEFPDTRFSRRAQSEKQKAGCR